MSGNVIVIEKDLLKSQAFRSLSAVSMIVYLDFRMKCQIKSVNVKTGRAKIRVILNNGQIEYCYSEAEKRGITRPRFKRALKELVEHGFIDIVHPGSGGIKGDKSKYSISDRWETWGTDSFKQATMRKDARKGRGFSAYWGRKNSNIGNVLVTQGSNKDVTSLRENTGFK
jgi:hypothetical protein